MSVKQGDNREEVGPGKPPKSSQWKPGTSGNPKGRPRSKTASEEIRARLSEINESDPERRTYGRIMAVKLVDAACSGDARAVQAVREVIDRTEGKARQTITLTTDRREQLERAVHNIIEEATARGLSITRDQAIEDLAEYVPDVRSLLIN